MNHLPTVMLIDEFNASKRIEGKMAFEFADGKTGELIDILPYRRVDKLIKYFMTYSYHARKSVKYVVLDMNGSYPKFIHAVFPNAQIIYDRFHIVQHMNKQMNQLRIAVMKGLRTFISQEAKDRNKLKRYWKLILKKPSEIDYSTYRQYPLFQKKWMTESEVIDYLLSVDERLRIAYRVFYELSEQYEKRDNTAFFGMLSNLSSITGLDKEFKKGLSSFRQYRRGICNAFQLSYSNGRLEGKNNMIKVIKRIAFGFRNFTHLKLRILLQQGVIRVN